MIEARPALIFSTLQLFFVAHLCIFKDGTNQTTEKNQHNTSREQLMLDIYSTVMHWDKQSK